MLATQLCNSGWLNSSLRQSRTLALLDYQHISFLRTTQIPSSCTFTTHCIMEKSILLWIIGHRQVRHLHNFTEPECSSPFSQNLTTNTSHQCCPHTSHLFNIHFNIILSIYFLPFQLKSCMHFPSFPCTQQSLAISSSLSRFIIKIQRDSKRWTQFRKSIFQN
jgi:hypothetical protein